jgi:(hydroxyamino)benzene mutase
MTTATRDETATRLLVVAAAWLMLVGLLTGGYIAAAMTGSVDADPDIAVAAHLNAILGGLWMIAVAWTLQFVRYGAAGQRRLAWLLVVANWTNWLVTAVKAALRVHGIAAGPPAANDVVFATLTVLVVLPSLAAAVAWIAGLRRSSPPG